MKSMRPREHSSTLSPSFYFKLEKFYCHKKSPRNLIKECQIQSDIYLIEDCKPRAKHIHAIKITWDTFHDSAVSAIDAADSIPLFDGISHSHFHDEISHFCIRNKRWSNVGRQVCALNPRTTRAKFHCGTLYKGKQSLGALS